MRLRTMRTQQYQEFQAQDDETRRGVFTQAASRVGITEFLAEKDYWVCRVLDILMREPPWIPKRFFKGGTSLSKGYGYIERFSEDVDIVFNRHSLKDENGRKFQGNDDPADPDAQLSNNQRRDRFDELLAACGRHMAGPLTDKLARLLPECRIVLSDADGQTLFVRYPSLFMDVDLDADEAEDVDYFRPRIKIEGGARSAQSPATERRVAPYIQAELQGRLDLAIEKVTMISPERTFLEKISIIHGINCGFRDQNRLPRDRDRISRHFYDIAKMSQVQAGQRAMSDQELLADVREHNQLAFRRAWARYDELNFGQVQIVPQAGIIEVLRRDYVRMQDMMFGERPTFDWILARLQEVDERMNPQAA